MAAKRENKFADMSDEEFNRPRYPISVVANLLDVHQRNNHETEENDRDEDETVDCTNFVTQLLCLRKGDRHLC